MLCGVLFCSFISCNESDTNLQEESEIEDSQLSNYLNSDYFKSFMENYDLSLNNVLIKEYEKGVIEKKGVNYYTIPVFKNGNMYNKLIVCINKKGDCRALFEDWSKDETDNWKINVSTTKGEYIATLQTKLNEYNKLSTYIVDVAEVDTQILSRGESWWQCTSRVYSTAKRACGDDDKCNFACDILDLVWSSCTVSIAVAAAVVCL